MGISTSKIITLENIKLNDEVLIIEFGKSLVDMAVFVAEDNRPCFSLSYKDDGRALDSESVSKGPDHQFECVMTFTDEISIDRVIARLNDLKAQIQTPH